jgi:uncharacterized membrane protein YuzA (DUF378 family)
MWCIIYVVDIINDKSKLSMLKKITFVLLVIGGLNWLLVGVFGWDVGQIFGGQTAMISRIVYVLVGLSAIVQILPSGKPAMTA